MSNDNQKVTDTKDSKEPVNTKTLNPSEQAAEEMASYDGKQVGDTNLKLMNKDADHKLHALLGKMGRNVETFGSEPTDTSFFPYAPRELGMGITMRAGSYSTGKKGKDGKAVYESHIGLPPQISLTDPDDWKKSITLDVFQLIELSKYLPKLLEANRPAISYFVAHAKEIQQRKIDEDCGY
jgi:hypothetical protein